MIVCGLAGSWEPRGERDGDELRRIAGGMARLVESRGPDDAGEWADPEAGIALGHRRLSIVDLSPRGRQPMVSAGGTLVIAYNGESYNIREPRAELEGAGASFRGDSDTEVLLEACAARGIEPALGRCIGALPSPYSACLRRAAGTPSSSRMRTSSSALRAPAAWRASASSR